MLGEKIAIGLSLVLGLLVCCAQPVGAAEVDRAFASRIDEFGFRTLNELSKMQVGKNVFISPVSLAMALDMTYNGASGDTQTAMAVVLDLGGYSPDQVNVASRALIESLENAGPGAKLNIANSLWARKGITFKPDFLQTNKDYFHAEIKEIEFGPAAVEAINSWVKSKTEGRIPQIIQKIQGDMILFLINAVYFKGEWTDQFDKTRTSDAPFTLADGTKVTVQMMCRRGSYTYFRDDGFQAISIPYGKGRMSMYIFLPDKPSGLPELCRKLNATTWESWMHKFSTASVKLSMPRFKIEYKAEDEMKAALKSMGMSIAFDPVNADFKRMCEIRGENVYISQIVHKTFVEVNEAGTEAAAATSVGMGFTAMPTQPVEMVVDHPFLCAIADNETGAILFVGMITNPKA